jgi:hypothetical protein
LDELFLGPDFELSSRYANSAILQALVLVYGSLAPIAYFLAFLALLLSQIADRYLCKSSSPMITYKKSIGLRLCRKSRKMGEASLKNTELFLLGMIAYYAGSLAYFFVIFRSIFP